MMHPKIQWYCKEELTVNLESVDIAINHAYLNFLFYAYGQLHTSHHATNDTNPKPISLLFLIISYSKTKFIQSTIMTILFLIV